MLQTPPNLVVRVTASHRHEVTELIPFHRGFERKPLLVIAHGMEELHT